MALIRGSGWPLLVALAVYAALLLPTLDRQGVNWDEQTDLDVAEAQASSRWGLVYGSRIDAINTRLPTFIASLTFRAFDADHLLLSRGLSVLVGALAILGTYCFCAFELGRTKGVVAAFLMATSPYVLFFSKQALTEGDVWIAAGLAWFLVAYAWYRRRPQPRRAAVVGLALGVALSAKISAVAFVPALLWASWRDSREAASPAGSCSTQVPSWQPRLLLLISALLAIWMILNAVVSLGVYGQLGLSMRVEQTRPLLRLGLGLAVAALFLRWIGRMPGQRPSWSLATAIVLLGAVLAFFLVPPIHTTNPWILGALGHQFFLSSGSGLDPGFLLEAAAFHLEVLVIKNSLGIGLGLLLALGAAFCFRRPNLRLARGVVVWYGVFLLLLPWAQTRYIMPLMVPLAILAADAFVELYRRRRVVALSSAALTVAFLIADFRSCYPDLNLNGYPWVGERYLTGRSTVGYRSIVHTPSDGIEQALRWVAPRVDAEETVATVFLETHITRAVLGDPPFRIDRLTGAPMDLSAVDWVLTSINFDIDPKRAENQTAESIFTYPWYDRPQLEREFEKVFSVRRAFDLEVASVWKRRKDESGTGPQEGVRP